MELNVLYEDNHLIAVYKPAGMLVQGDESGDSSLMDEVKFFLKQKYNKPGNVFLGLLHRLDRPVAGIVLFAKTSKGASRLSEQFRSRKVKKIYHCLVEGTVPEKSGTLIHFLRKDEKENKVYVTATEVPGSLRAELDYTVVKRYDNKDTSLVQVELKTGRPHQIRVQLSTIGCPIVGDVKYGAKEGVETILDGTPHHIIALCATDLTFELATSPEHRSLHVDVPAEWDNL